MQVMALVCDQSALVIEKCIRFLAACSAQRQSHSSWVNARAGRFRARLRTLGFLCHAGPQARCLAALRHRRFRLATLGTLRRKTPMMREEILRRTQVVGRWQGKNGGHRTAKYPFLE
jgi:hypothetical protein